MAPELINPIPKIADGTRFIKYVSEAGDTFMFETRDGGIFSVGINSKDIQPYYKMLGKGAFRTPSEERKPPARAVDDYCEYGRTIGEINPQHHSEMHLAGLSEGENHSHWGSRSHPDRQVEGTNPADGFVILGILAPKFANDAKDYWNVVTQILQLARVVPPTIKTGAPVARLRRP